MQVKKERKNKKKRLASVVSSGRFPTDDADDDVIDIVYAVVYSLLLLNTDLHVAQGNHAKMPRQAFVRNTMATIRDQRIQRHDKHWEAELETYLKVISTLNVPRQETCMLNNPLGPLHGC